MREGDQDAPGGGPALSSKRVYVPIVTGLIVAYRIESPDKAPTRRGCIEQTKTDDRRREPFQRPKRPAQKEASYRQEGRRRSTANRLGERWCSRW